MGDRRACIIPWETTVALTRSSLTYTVRSLCHCFHICDEEAEVNGSQWPQAHPGLGFHGLRVPGVGMEGRGTLKDICWLIGLSRIKEQGGSLGSHWTMRAINTSAGNHSGWGVWGVLRAAARMP